MFNVYSLHSSLLSVSGLEMIIDWYVFVLKIQFYIVFYLLLFNFMCYFHCPNSSSECWFYQKFSPFSGGPRPGPPARPELASLAQARWNFFPNPWNFLLSAGMNITINSLTLYYHCDFVFSQIGITRIEAWKPHSCISQSDKKQPIK